MASQYLMYYNIYVQHTSQDSEYLSSFQDFKIFVLIYPKLENLSKFSQFIKVYRTYLNFKIQNIKILKNFK